MVASLVMRISIEKQIAYKIVNDALAAGYLVSVFDGGEFTVKKSSDAKAIKAALFTTDDDTLVIRDADGKLIGKVWLVYGNDGFDVIADHSANAATEALLAGANAKAAKLEEMFG